jgi:thiol-disulfide isomerase/thioredoxin
MSKIAAAVLLLAAVMSSNLCLAGQKIVYGDANAVKHQIAADKGHVVLLNFWATWCAPCVAEYPSLVKLNREYKGPGLDVIAVSLDLHEDIDGKVVPFIAAQKPNFTQFVLDADDPEKAIDAFDPTWQGDIPRTFVYSKSGRLVKVMSGQQTYAAFNNAIKQAFASR